MVRWFEISMQLLLVVLPEDEAVVRARRDEERGREHGRNQRDEVDVAVELAQLREPVRERNREQEGEEHLLPGARRGAR